MAKLEELLTLDEVASYLRVTKKTLYRLLEGYRIPVTKVGRQWRFDKASIDAWLRKNSAGRVANILVIDDDETICSLFEDTLEEEGHTLTTVSDSSKGLALVKHGDYDLVFLDLKMPGMNGVELFGEIRVAKPELPVTIITGYPDSDLMKRALDRGPLGVMNKPFSGSDILVAVKTYLRFGVLNK